MHSCLLCKINYEALMGMSYHVVNYHRSTRLIGVGHEMSCCIRFTLYP